jgi:hypothetical protein
MRGALVAAGLLLSIATGADAAPDEAGPIDFVVGNEVFTRRAVLRQVGAQDVISPATPRAKVFQAVRLRLARESVLFQHALHLGIQVSAEDVRAQLREEIRRSEDAGTFHAGMRQVHAEDLAQYVELRRRRATLDEYHRRLMLGAEWERVQPVQLLFVESRPADVIAAGRALQAERTRNADGWLWEARVEGAGAPERAAALAKAWREAPAVRALAPDAALTAIQATLAGAGVATEGVAIDRVRLTQADWAGGVYDVIKARPLHQALQGLQPGAVSEPVAFGAAHYVFRLVATVHPVVPPFASVEDDARGEHIRSARDHRVRLALADALRTMHVWPPEMAAALRQDAGLGDAKN